MTQFAGRILTTDLDIIPGEIKTYRLPATMPGALVLHANRRLPIPSGANPPGSRLGAGAVPSPALDLLIAQPGELVLDLLHGDTVVQSGRPARDLRDAVSLAQARDLRTFFDPLETRPTSGIPTPGKADRQAISLPRTDESHSLFAAMSLLLGNPP
jgi:hypothetical protein